MNGLLDNLELNNDAYPPYPWQQELWQHLMLLQNQQRLPHALLLSGAKGWGKFALAKAFAQSLLCKQPQNQHACGHCKDCLLCQAQDGHPDVIQLLPDGKMQMIKVEAIREVVQFMEQTSLMGGYHIIIINEAHSMNISAANCLLKTLEEPGPQSLILLLSDTPALLMPTIRSRCQQVLCQTLWNSEVETWLKPYVTRELPASILWRLTDGGPLAIKALSESEQLQFAVQFLQQLLQNFEPLTLAADCSKQPLAITLRWLIHMLGDCIKVKTGATESLIFTHWQEAIQKLCQNVELTKLFAYLKKCYHYQHILYQKVSINELLALEDLLLEWQTLCRMM